MYKKELKQTEDLLKSRLTRYESEENVNGPENRETDERDTRYLGKKIMEIEYDDKRN